MTIKEVAEKVSKIFGGIPVEFKESRAGEFRSRMSSQKKALEELNRTPQFNLEDGIKRYVE